ncbi:sensor histidine kinase [Undibacterium sp. TJN25]|uniref:sensor histidine kinase n=1 Tax=Undibacterium sp. TJN25 TaxID=3413056 RepID=UPI003BF0A3D6
MTASRALTPHAWMADGIALLACFCIVESASVCLRKSEWLLSTAARWIVLAAATGAGIAISCVIQQEFWPATLSRHPAWLLPAVLAAFIVLLRAPEEINAEVRRRAGLALAQAQVLHQAERRILEARLAALQGQIEPHFLYNTLANTRALIRQDAGAAETMLNHLIAYLRAAMPDLRENTTSLGQELQRAQAFLDILKIRLGERLNFHISAAPEACACMIPPLAVMTLVENAIKHGIEPRVRGGSLRIDANCNAGWLTVSVADDGVGFQSETGGGIGLLNLQERLHVLFGPAAELRLEALDPCGVKASFVLPVTKGESVQ